MAIWEVVGADRETGQPARIQVESATDRQAEEAVNRIGVMVSSVNLISFRAHPPEEHDFTGLALISMFLRIFGAFLCAVGVLIFIAWLIAESQSKFFLPVDAIFIVVGGGILFMFFGEIGRAFRIIALNALRERNADGVLRVDYGNHDF